MSRSRPRHRRRLCKIIDATVLVCDPERHRRPDGSALSQSTEKLNNICLKALARATTVATLATR
jgi:hypothetical protein